MDGRTWHILTGEFPPRPGGVSDYTLRIGEALAASGRDVHVWCPSDGASSGTTGLSVHPDLGALTSADLRRVGRLLDGYPRPRRLLVQWVPHAFGYRSMNIHFCAWLLGRSAAGDVIDLMVHEPYLRFAGSAGQRAAAAVHRLMTVLLLRAAARVWVSIPAWKPLLRPFLLGRRVPMEWLPIPSNVVPVDDPEAVATTRRGLTSAPLLVGHFGTYGPGITAPLERAIVDVLRRDDSPSVLLLGRHGPEFRADVLRRAPDTADRLIASGPLDQTDLSIHLQACDVMIQPFPDGISTRRTTIMACLAHGLPVVSTIGELSETLWRDQAAVALADVGDSAGLAREVLRLVQDSDLRAAMGRAARRLYDERFTVQHVVDRLVATIE